MEHLAIRYIFVVTTLNRMVFQRNHPSPSGKAGHQTAENDGEATGSENETFKNQMAYFMHQITESLHVDGFWEVLTPTVTFRAVDKI